MARPGRTSVGTGISCRLPGRQDQSWTQLRKRVTQSLSRAVGFLVTPSTKDVHHVSYELVAATG